MINRVVLIGRLTRDPELRYSQNGTPVATFTLAVNRTYTNQAGEREADFINIVAWRQLAEICANHLQKGRQAAVEGRLQTRSYENKEGKRVYVTEVVADQVQFLGGAKNDEEQQRRTTADDIYGDGEPINISDDDLPF